MVPTHRISRFHFRNQQRSRGITYQAAEAGLRSEPYRFNLFDRPGEPRELNYAPPFLASSESSCTTGAVSTSMALP
jgi:hypothetical protein